jgi:hypothetical protein
MKVKRNKMWCPPAMKVQLARLFGPSSPEARLEMATSTQWRRILQKVLRELDRYLSTNVETDAVHRLMLHSALAAADDSLIMYDFWPAYVEGITRLALLLMGDYPDHRSRRKGRPRTEHYRLSRLREVRYLQSPAQKLHTLLAAPQVGIPLKTPPGRALIEFRKQVGPEAGAAEFFLWYRKNHPEDYAAVF